ncbi:MAG: hypothetical protein QXT13_10305 [Pyrobaculum sp.]
MTQKKKRGRPGNPPVTCPRCGLLGYRVIERRGGRLYVYYKHPELKKSCYVGPVAEYEYVERFYELELTNIERRNYSELAKRAISYIAMRRDFEQLLELLTYIVHVLKEQYDVDKIIERIKSTQRQPAELSL